MSGDIPWLGITGIWALAAIECVALLTNHDGAFANVIVGAITILSGASAATHAYRVVKAANGKRE